MPKSADVAPVAANPAAFIARWSKSGGSERANYTSFLSELCDILSVPRPEPTQTDITKNAYVFERHVFFQNTDGTTSTGRIDLYKRGCFILEAKQGTEQTADELQLSSTPKRLAEQAQAVAQRLQAAAKPLTAADLAKAFTKAKEADIAELLETLVTLGKAHPVKGERYAAV